MVLKKLNKLRKAKSRTADMKKEDIVSNTVSKIFHQQMGEQDNEFNKLSKAEKMSFTLHTILVIDFLGIMIIKICLRHHKVMKKYYSCH